MTLYIDADLVTDEVASAEAILAGIADRLNAALGLDPDVDGWVSEEGQPETHIAEAVGIVLATAAALVQDTERNNFIGLGRILGLDPLPAEPATGFTEWTFASAVPGTDPVLIPDGSQLVLDAADGTPVAYATVGDILASGASATDVAVVAIEPGQISNGLVGLARDWEPLPFVTSVEMTTAPSGGRDAQTTEEYLDAIVREARRMKVVPVVTDDYADQALDNPAVARAVAIRLLNAEAYPATPNSPGHVTIFAADEAGAAVSAGVKADLIASMQGVDRPVGVTVHIQDPTVNNLTLALTIRVAPDADEPATVAAVQDALNAAYDPATWATDDTVAGRWRAPVTAADRTVYAFDVADIASDVPGVLGVTAATVNGGASAALTGWAPLPHLTAPPTVTVA